MGSPQMLGLLVGIVVKRHHPIPVVDQISRCLQSSLATLMLTLLQWFPWMWLRASLMWSS